MSRIISSKNLSGGLRIAGPASPVLMPLFFLLLALNCLFPGDCSSTGNSNSGNNTESTLNGSAGIPFMGNTGNVTLTYDENQDPLAAFNCGGVYYVYVHDGQEWELKTKTNAPVSNPVGALYGMVRADSNYIPYQATLNGVWKWREVQKIGWNVKKCAASEPCLSDDPLKDCLEQNSDSVTVYEPKANVVWGEDFKWDVAKGTYEALPLFADDSVGGVQFQIDPADGLPVVLYRRNPEGISLKKYLDGEWINLGRPSKYAVDKQIVFAVGSDSRPVVAFISYQNGTADLVVRKLTTPNEDGWDFITPTVTSFHSELGQLAIADDGTHYFALAVGWENIGAFRVLRWETRSEWTDLGSPIAETPSAYALLADPNDYSPMLAYYQEGQGIVIQKSDSQGGWAEYSIFNAEGITAFFQLAVNPMTGTLILMANLETSTTFQWACYQSVTGADWEPLKQMVAGKEEIVDCSLYHGDGQFKFSEDGSIAIDDGLTVSRWESHLSRGWESLGLPGGNVLPAAVGISFSSKLMVLDSSDRPIIIIQDSSGKAHVHRYHEDTEWTDLGAVSDPKATELGLLVDSDNTPIVYFVDEAGKAKVKRWASGNDWDDLGTLSKQFTDITLDPDGNPVGSILPYGINQVSLLGWSGNGWDEFSQAYIVPCGDDESCGASDVKISIGLDNTAYLGYCFCADPVTCGLGIVRQGGDAGWESPLRNDLHNMGYGSGWACDGPYDLIADRDGRVFNLTMLYNWGFEW